MGDVCDQTAATELATILREGGFGPLMNLLEEGKPLTPAQIAQSLKISRVDADKMLAEARDLLLKSGIKLPAPTQAKPKSKKKKRPSRPSKPARAIEPRPVHCAPSRPSSPWLAELRETVAALKAGAVALARWTPRVKRAIAALRAS